MTFLLLGIIFALRMGFPLILTQMVYVPNIDIQNDLIETSGELTCPSGVNIYPTTPNDTDSNLVREIIFLQGNHS